MKTITIEKAMETVADIAAASVLKNLVGKWQEEKTVELRAELQLDKVTLRRTAYIGEKTTRLENANAKLKDEIESLKKEMALLKKRIKTEESDHVRELLVVRYWNADAMIYTLKEEIKRNNAEKENLYRKLSETLEDGNDLKQTAFLAMWEYVETVKTWAEKNPYFSVEEIGNIVVDREYKTVRTAYRGISKDGNIATFYKAERDENGEIIKAWQDVTLRHVGARAVNQYVNQYRNKVALNSVNIIVGYDDNGNELTLQNSKLETLGGVDSLEEKLDFDMAWKKVESVLTLRQCEIIKLILAGYSYSDIADKLGVKTSTICNHVATIRKKATEIFPAWEK